MMGKLVFFSVIFIHNLIVVYNQCAHSHHLRPIAAPFNVCAYWLPDNNGLTPSKIVYNHNLTWSLHGWWPQVLLPQQSPIPYQQFYSYFIALNLTNHFLDMTPSQHCCCSAYHEYKKHGAHSGYNITTWINQIKWCLAVKTQLSHCYVHQCRYNHVLKCNIPQSCTLPKPLSPTIGCRMNFPICNITS